MSEQQVRYEVENRTAWVTINRPEAMNALTPELLQELKAAVDKAGRDDKVGVIVLTGEGKAFSAGVDLKVLKGRSLSGGSVGDVLDVPARDLTEALRTVPKAVIALVNGYCFTGALELVLACDLVVASDKARFGDTHVRWGLRPTWGMSQRLPRTVGFLKAKELSFTARTCTAEEAERIGLVNQVAPAETARQAAQELADGILTNSLEAVAAVKRLYNDGWNMSLADGLAFEYGNAFTISDTMDRLKEFL